MFMSQILLEVVTPSRNAIRTEAQEVYVPGVMGEFGILPQHTPFVTQLNIGTLSFKKDGKTRKYVISGGFAEVCNDHLIILTESCESAEDVKLDESRKHLAQLEKTLLTMDASSAEYRGVWDQARLEKARVDVRESSDII